MRIAFISCVKSKLDKECEAKYLYTSDLFKKSLKYTLSNYDKVYILSAKYYLLELDDVIKPYELTLNNLSEKEKKIWSYRVYHLIKDKIGLDNEFYFYCGINYRKYLIKKLKGYEPLKGVSFGNQLKFYKENI